MSFPGFRRLSWFVRTVRLLKNWPDVYRQRFSRAAPSRQLLKLRSGLTFEVAHKERSLPILMEVMQRRVYAPGLALGESPVVIDIGGHIGAFTMFTMQQAPRARVLVFEPEPLSFELLQRNIGMNGFSDRVIASRRAVCGTGGTRTLFASGSSPVNSLFRHNTQAVPVSVPCTTLAEIFARHRIDRCDLLKIDCEGAEYEILYSAPSDVLARVQRIVLEWHGIPGHTPEALEQFLRSQGFSTQRPRYRIIVAERLMRAVREGSAA